jgi:hypothetical protein
VEAEQVKNQDNVSQLQPLCPAAPETRKITGFPFMSVYELGVNESTPMEELTLGQGNVKHNFQTNNLFIPIPTVFIFLYLYNGSRRASYLFMSKSH